MVGVIHKLGWFGGGALLLDAGVTHGLAVSVLGVVSICLQLVNNLLIRKNKKNEKN